VVLPRRSQYLQNLSTANRFRVSRGLTDLTAAV
jgi:hypothetical protein